MRFIIRLLILMLIAIPVYALVIPSGGGGGGSPSGSAGGDLSGTYPNPTVAKVNGAAVPASASLLGSNGSNQLISESTVPTSALPDSTGWLVTNHGILENGKVAFDGATASGLGTASQQATSVTTTCPAVTSSVNNDTELCVIGSSSAQTVPGATTQRILQVANGGGHNPDLYLGDVTSSTTGSQAAITGSQASSGTTTGMSILLVPTSGNTASYVASNAGSAATSTTITLNVPTGTTNGMFMVACFAAGGATGATTSGTFTTKWNMLPNTSINGSGQSLMCWYRWAQSEPASYTISQNVAAVYTAFIATYQNVLAVDIPITSVSAAFVAGDVGKDVCLMGASSNVAQVNAASFAPSVRQQCGIVQAVNSGTSIYTSLVPKTGLSSEEYIYCGDDTSNWNTLFTNITTSGHNQLFLPTGISCIAGGDLNGGGSGQVSLPYAYTLTIAGEGAVWPWHAGNNGSGATYQTSGTNNLGSAIVVMNTAGTKNAIQVLGSNGSSGNSYITRDTRLVIQNISLIGGVGYGRDAGGGNTGLYIENVPDIVLRNLYIDNFGQNQFNNTVGGTAITLEANGYSSTSGFIAETLLDNVAVTNSGKYGLQLTCAGTSPNFQNTQIFNSHFDYSGDAGIDIDTCQFQGMAIANNIIARNCLVNNSSQIVLTNSAKVQAGQMTGGNYFEQDTGTCTDAGQGTGWTGMDWSGAQFNVVNSSPFLPVFSGSGATALDTCSASYGHARQCVSDAAACTSGTTYAQGGGSVTCTVQCKNGTGWVETGSAQCY